MTPLDAPASQRLIFFRRGSWCSFVPGQATLQAIQPREHARELPAPHASEAPPADQTLVLRTQFAMRCRAVGLFAASWHEAGGEEELSAAMVETLQLFAAPRHVAQALEAGAVASLVALAQHHGWLLPHHEPTARVTELRDARPLSAVASPVRPSATPDPRLVIYGVVPEQRYLPAALGMIRAYAESVDGGRLRDLARFVPFVRSDPKQVARAFFEHGPGVWLFSDYLWSEVENLAASQLVKHLSQANFVVHGGPSAPKYPLVGERFLRDNPTVDVLVLGEGEATAAELLLRLSERHAAQKPLVCGALRDVPGLSMLVDDAHVQTAPRARMSDLDVLPSPALSGIYDDLVAGATAITIETNRGCPYGCTFCDWGSATLQKIRKFADERVRDELAWASEQKIPIVWLADANFGIFERDVAFAVYLAELHQANGFPREVIVNYAKNATLRVAEIVRILTRAGMTTQGIISIQTRDEQTLAVIRRSNIKTKRYEELAAVFAEEGLPLTVELMLGLPGSTRKSLVDDLAHYFEQDIAVRIYDTLALPNSPMADPDYVALHGIVTDARGYVLQTHSFSQDDLVWMDRLARFYSVSVGHGVLRHALCYLRDDHQVAPLDFLQALLDRLQQAPESLPNLSLLELCFEELGFFPGGWSGIYQELARFADSAFGVPLDSGFRAVLAFNEAVMPEQGYRYPRSVALEHDVVAHRTKGSGPLATRGPATLLVEDPDNLVSRLLLRAEQAEFLQSYWELGSPLARARSRPHFVAHTNRSP